MLDDFCEAARAVCRNRSPVKCNPQIVPHGLHALVVFAIKPGQHGVPWEIIHPLFERLRHIDTQCCSLTENGRARLRRKNGGPEFGSGKFLTNIHHEIDSLTPFLISLSRITENDMEDGM